MITVELSGKRGAGQFAILDDVDSDLAQMGWYLQNTGYAVHQENKRSRALHRVILGLEIGDPRVGDHINGDRLDNRRSNLRIGTPGLNAQNQRPRVGTSTHRGVSWHKRIQKWTANVQHAGNRYFLGYFHSEIDAAIAAQEKRLEVMPFAVEPLIPHAVYIGTQREELKL